MRRKLKQFPEIVHSDLDVSTQRLKMRALPAFDQYVALEHNIEDGGGEIMMFHPRYITPRPYHATIGIRNHDLDKIEALKKRLQQVPGVRTVVVDAERWFTNPGGVDVGGAVVFADQNPRLELDLPSAAQEAGFIWEPKEHGHSSDDHDEWSEMNHAFAGLCLVLLSMLGMFQLALKDPPWIVRYGAPGIWLSLFVFLFIRSDRDAWPLGPLGWWESFRAWDTAQHRVGTGLILLIGIGDLLRIRKGLRVNPAFGKWGALTIGLGGSIMLYTHLHSTIDPTHFAMAWRMNVQHLMMATCALLISVTKFVWETWRQPRRGGEYVWLVWLMLLGVVLLLYVE